MYLLVNTEYQDIYRVIDGVLLVVNKFVPINYKCGGNYFVRCSEKQKKYHKTCQKWLKVLTEDYYDKYQDITVPKGTVTYIDRPVIATDNKFDWTYEVKTTGNALSGEFYLIENLLSNILYTIRTGQVR